MQKPFKFRYASHIAGTFVIFFFILLLTGIFVASHKQGWFEGKFVLRTTFDASTGAFGLREGNEVMILNTLAGRVGKIMPTPDGNMETSFIIKDRFKQFVRTDSVAKVSKKFVAAGDSYVEIEPGTGAEVKDGAAIKCVKDEEIIDTAQNVLSDVQEVVLPMVDEVKELLKHMNAILADIEKGEGVAGALVNDPEMSRDIKSVIHNSNIVIQESQKTFRESTRLIRAFQRSWLVRRYVKKEEEESHLLSPLYMDDDSISSLRDYCEDSLRLARAENRSSEIAYHACNLGYILLREGKAQEVQALLDEARAELVSIGSSLTYPMLLEAEYLRRKGQYEAAYELMEYAAAKLGRGDREMGAQCFLSAARASCDMKKPGSAENALERAERFLKKLKVSALEAEACGVRGRIKLLRKDPDAAAQQFDEESGLRRKAGQIEAMASALVNAAMVYESTGELGKSADRYFRAGRSMVYGEVSRQARPHLQKAVDLAKRSGDGYIVSQGTILLGEIE